MKELKESRNFKSGFEKGIWLGLLLGKVHSMTKGHEPWTLTHKKRDCDFFLP
jgi:hypothetical protein